MSRATLGTLNQCPRIIIAIRPIPDPIDIPDEIFTVRRENTSPAIQNAGKIPTAIAIPNHHTV